MLQILQLFKKIEAIQELLINSTETIKRSIFDRKFPCLAS